MGVSAWEAIFMLVVLKIPIVYLSIVVWWAVRAEPRPLEGAGRLVEPIAPEDGPRRAWRPRGPRGLRPGPHGTPVRGYARREAPAHARVDLG
jgi:hypothetical protein